MREGDEKERGRTERRKRRRQGNKEREIERKTLERE